MKKPHQKPHRKLKAAHKKSQSKRSTEKPLRIALAQINPVLGDFVANRKKIEEGIRHAAAEDCDLVIFPESALFGYLPNDLLERDDFVMAQLQELKLLQKTVPKGLAVLVGCFSQADSKSGSAATRKTLSQKVYFNSGAWLESGKRVRFFHKERLPSYDIFDEPRHLKSGKTSDNFISFKGQRLLITICEDIWGWGSETNQLPALSKNKVDVVLNLSASPFTTRKRKDRLDVAKRTAQAFRAPLVYVTMTGAQDEVIFDGRSLVLDAKGNLHQELAAFREDFRVVEVSEKTVRGSKSQSQKISEIEIIRDALTLGLRDFVLKSGLKKVHLGLSGGVDSAVVACLATRALGPEAVTCVTLPGPYNDPRSRDVSEQLAQNLGVRSLNFEIDPAFKALSRTLDETYGALEFGLLHENLQSRIRGLLLMAVSNREGSLLLNTGNKSEIAAGYSTLYGDQCGGLAVIGDLLKAEVYALAELFNRDHDLIPKWILERPPSAELRPGQKDSDSLPDYDRLDAAVTSLVEERKAARSDVEMWLMKSLFKNEFKRWQSPPILKVKDHSFGRGRRMPIAGRFSL